MRQQTTPRCPSARCAATIQALALAALAAAFACPAHGASLTRTSAFEYDPATGLLTKEIIEPDSSQLCLVTFYAYDAFGNKTAVTTRNCNGSSGEAPAPAAPYAIATRTSTTTYDAQGRFATASSNALNQTETRAYDPRFGTLTSLTGPNGLTTTWTYDGFGRKTQENRADGTGTTWTYGLCTSLGGPVSCAGDGRIALTRAITGAPTVTTYTDSLNRKIRTEKQGFDGTLIRQDTVYDARGRIAQASRPYYSTETALWTVFSRDILGRVTSETTPDDSTTTTAYDGLTTTVTNALAQTRTTVKNSQGQTVSVTDAAGGTVTYVYDPFGNLTQTNAGGAITTLTYDLRGRKTGMVDPDMGTWSYVYDVASELVGQTDAKGQVTTMAYDPLGRMTSRTEPDMTSTWYYDAYKGGGACAKGIGKLCQVTADNGYGRTYAYDGFGRVSQLTLTIDTDYPITYTYDSASRLATLDYPSSTPFTVKYVYNANGYLSEVHNNADDSVLWKVNSLNALGEVTSATYGNGLTGARSYDAMGRPTNVAAGTVQNMSYVYDALGNVTQRTDGVNNVQENFHYDTLNRLTQVSGPNLTTVTAQYDALGNTTYKSDVGTFTYPAPNQARPHAMTSISGARGATYSYDANGNMTGYSNAVLFTGTRSIGYTSFNMPAQIAGNSAGGLPYSASFSYGPDHQRLMMNLSGNLTTSETVTYVNPDGRLLYEKTVPTYSYLPIRRLHYITAGAELIGVYSTTQTQIWPYSVSTQFQYYLRDALGSIQAITDSTGAVIEALSYDAFGKRRHLDGSPDPTDTLSGVNTKRGYTSQEHIDLLALIHMNGRIYDPALGRFLTPDPYLQSPQNLQSYNRYAYVLNNPLIYTDPNGYFSLGGFLGDLFGGIGDVATSIVHGVEHALRNPVVRTAAAVAAAWFGYYYDWWGAGGGLFGAQYPAANALAAGFAGGFVGSGGNFEAGLQGMATAGLFYGAGSLASLNGWTQGGWQTVAAHAAVGCVAAEMGSAQCRQGALAAGVAEFAGPYVQDIQGTGQLVAMSVVGGTVSALDGGKFANGAYTAAFGYLFNCLAHECLKHYVEGSGEPMRANFSELGARNIGPNDFPQYRALVSNTDLANGTYTVKDFIGWQTQSLNARIAYGRVILQLNGVLTVSQGQYTFTGTISAPPDLYDFDPQQWGIRTYYGEISTRIGTVLPGKPFYNVFAGSKPVSTSGSLLPF